MDARKSTLKENDALRLVEQASRLYVAKGKKVVYFDLEKERLDRETVRKLLLGPTGNLRAPTLRKGKTLIVGFDEATYRKVFG